MKLRIEIVEGTLKGLRHTISKGTRIGRTRGEVVIDDAKISSLHAEVEEDSNGNLLLTDLGSSNGIVVNNNRVNRVAMMPGLVFTLGRTTFLVSSVDGAPKTIPKTEIAPAKEPVEAVNRHWTEVLKTHLTDPKLKFKQKKIMLKPFHLALKLIFTKGYQYGTEWVVSYGPRKVGSQAVDLQILDPDAPAWCFELTAETKGVIFTTHIPDVVRLNQQQIKSKPLVDGDTISFGSTEMIVQFLEEA